MRYVYVKKNSKKRHPKIVMFSTISLVIGTLTLLWAFYPIAIYQIGNMLALRKDVSPLPPSVLASSLQKGLKVYNEESAPYYSSYLKDFTQVADWFPKKPQTLSRKGKVTEYRVSIPRLGINEAKVVVGGEDLAKTLVQYGDRVMPGEIGNATILGHSTLPQLYKDDDYKSIFTYLPTIERGDKIKININNFSYEYVVYDMFVVDPDEVWVLDEKADESVISLITCVPPGTYWKRLVVKAKLIKL